jgi:hypothetical protein
MQGLREFRDARAWEALLDKRNVSLDVFDEYTEFTALGAPHHEQLDPLGRVRCLTTQSWRFWRNICIERLDELEDMCDPDRAIHLRELGKQPRKYGAMYERQVRRIGRVSG